MSIKLADRATQIQASPTLAVNTLAKELKAQGKDVISMGVGEPDFNTPESAKEAGIKAIQNNFTRYTPVDGIPELKKALRDKFKHDNRLDYDLDQIIVGTGGKQVLYNACQVLLNPGDEAIIPCPYWVSYPTMVELAGGVPKYIKTTHEQRFKITAEQLEAAITDKTKLLFLNSPSNPTGVKYSDNELKALAQVLLQHPNIIIISDDIYEHISWDGQMKNIVNVCHELYDRTIIANGVAKAYAMTGWRIGFAAGPKEVIKAMTKVQSHSTSNACSIAQKATVGALQGDQSGIATMVEAYKARHDMMVAGINQIPGFHCIPTDGTFYLFPNVEGAMQKLGIDNDVDFAKKLLEEGLVAAVPGSGFGAPGYLRLSIALDMETLQTALARISALFV